MVNKWESTQSPKTDILYITYIQGQVKKLSGHGIISVLPVTLSTSTCHLGNSCSKCRISFLFLLSEKILVRFHHNVCFGWDWWKTLECSITCTLRHARWINVIFTVPCEVNIMFYQRLFLGTSANQKRHLKSYYQTLSFILSFQPQGNKFD
jgi:hypothetical protein